MSNAPLSSRSRCPPPEDTFAVFACPNSLIFLRDPGKVSTKNNRANPALAVPHIKYQDAASKLAALLHA